MVGFNNSGLRQAVTMPIRPFSIGFWWYDRCLFTFVYAVARASQQDLITTRAQTTGTRRYE